MGLVVSSYTLGLLSCVSLVTSAILAYRILASRRFFKSIRVALVLSITVADFVSSAYPNMYFAVNAGEKLPDFSGSGYSHFDQVVSTFLAMNFVYAVGLLCLNAEVIARNKLKTLRGQRLGALKVTFFVSPWLCMLVIFLPWFGQLVLTSASLNTFLSFFTLVVPLAVSAVASFVVCSPRMDQTHDQNQTNDQHIESAVFTGTNPPQDMLQVGSPMSLPGIQEGSVGTVRDAGGVASSLAHPTVVTTSVTPDERPPSYQESQLFQTTRSALHPTAAPSTPQDAPANFPTPQDAPANMGYTRFNEIHELRPKSERRQLLAVCMTFTFLSLPLWISVMIVVNSNKAGQDVGLLMALEATFMHLFTLKSCVISIMWFRYLALTLASPPCRCCFPGPSRPRVIFAD